MTDSGIPADEPAATAGDTAPDELAATAGDADAWRRGNRCINTTVTLALPPVHHQEVPR